jgi:hypothetical protein
MCSLAINPQSQNQVLDIHELYKPDILNPPPTGFVGCFRWILPTWRWAHMSDSHVSSLLSL